MKRGLVSQGMQPRRRKEAKQSSEHKQRRCRSEEIEHQSAVAVGLPPHHLTKEETAFLPTNIDIDVYLPIRNHLVMKWRTHPKQYLSLPRSQKRIQKRHADMTAMAWKFLNHCGFINFGVSSALNREMRSQSDDRGSVIVIGAGLAGLAAARHLRMSGHRVVVLEARDRIGGRVDSQLLKEKDEEVVVDFGGSIISGIDGNPLALLASQLDIPLHQIRQETPLHFNDGSVVSRELDKESDIKYNALLDDCASCREALGKVAERVSLDQALGILWSKSKATCSKELQSLIQWHFANLEFANASRLDEVSLKGWDQDDPYELHGPHVFLAGGNGQLINALAQNIHIVCNECVKSVRYAQSGVEVATDTAIHAADVVLVTVPLGVLKRNAIAFDPPLSPRKTDAIERLGYGMLNKIVMWFPVCFWSKKGDTFGYLAEEESERGMAFLFYSYTRVSGGPVLAALIAGSAAESLEIAGNEAIFVDKVLEILRRIFDDKGKSTRSAQRVPDPIKVCCTKWGTDQYSYGSYSSVRVGSAGGDDYDILAENIGERVFFAGEATTSRHPATMHGAFLSGQREAAHIASALCRKKGQY